MSARLSATSAGVLILGGADCYGSSLARDYLSRLDLSAGAELAQKCLDIWQHYGAVIVNRKFAILHLLKQHCSAECQVVIAAAGLDPLGLELVASLDGVRVFDVDAENMDVKSDLLATMGVDAGVDERIRCVAADLADSDALRVALVESGWSPDMLTILVMEGISYYLSVADTRSLIGCLQPWQVVFEFLRTEAEIANDRVDIPRQIFAMLARECDLGEICRYDEARIRSELGMQMARRYSMHEIERLRSAGTDYFPSVQSGWIDVCLLEAIAEA